MKLIDNWKCDMFKWHHYGRRKLQTDPIIIKTYYNFIGPDGEENPCFKKYVYTLSQRSNKRVVIHYKGDDSIATNTTPHIRTYPSVLRELEKSEVTPAVAYKRKVATSGPSHEHSSVQLPRNRKQVKNLQSRSGIII